ncbi:TonB-dependent receptor [Phenylobacterium koreense]|uniref:Iron complex outermembrane receptor protein n=1 Tax=Phenylobacterium koreense TaxID=266125 RepID=A0ABV2ENG5_9CAUL
MSVILNAARSAAVVYALSASSALAQETLALPSIDVASGSLANAPGEALSRTTLAPLRSTTSDAAALVARTPGVSTFGAGGFSGLPVIRGLESQRLTILVDGASIDISCPNQMNPPLSYVDPQTIDAINAITGVTPVSMGGDSIGGAILVETAAPRFAKAGGRLVTGEVSTYYRSNGGGVGGAVLFTAADDRLSFAYSGSFAQAGNYEGGSGDGEVRSTEHQKTDHAISLAAQTDAGLFELKGGYHYAPYEGFPNQYMDMTSDRSWHLNGHWKGLFDWGDLDLRAFYRDTDHEMNFLADKGGDAGRAMPMNTEVHSAGSTLKGDILLSNRDTLRLGGEFHHQWLNDYWPAVAGSAMMGPDTYVNVNGAKRDRLGVFAEWEALWTPQVTTLVGVRNDQVWMNTGRVQPYSTSMMNMADAKAAAAFNAADRQRHDSNWSAMALLRYAPDQRTTFEVGYARKSRSPNIYERYSWGRGSMSSRMVGWFGDGNGYVGDVALEPERADTVSAAASLKGDGDGWALRIAPYYTRVHDYIDVVKLADFTDTTGAPTGFAQLQFANRKAEFYGVDVSGAVPLWRSSAAGSTRLTATASWLRGRNLDGGGALYHQMPFNAKLGLEHQLGGWESAAELELVADKNRVDARRNEPRTAGYALINLRTGYAWGRYRLNLDVQNLLDKDHDLPLGGMSLGDLRATGDLRPVPGRGRSVNIGLAATF